MMPTLLIVLGIYLAACYAYGMYLAIRLFTGRRLRHTAAGLPPRRVIRPIAPAGYSTIPGDLPTQADEELDPSKVAA